MEHEGWRDVHIGFEGDYSRPAVHAPALLKRAKLTGVARATIITGILLFAASAALGGAPNLFGVRQQALELEREIQLGELAGGVFAWSPDSRQLAIAGAFSGDIEILDAQTGDMTRRTSSLAGAGAIAWSPLGDRIAVSGLDGVAIVGLGSDPGKFIDVPAEGIRHPGPSLAFSQDGSGLLINPSGREEDTTLLFRYDLKSNVWGPALRSPYAGRHVVPDATTNAFYVFEGKLYYFVRLARYDDGRQKDGSNNPFETTSPSTCIAFEFSDDANSVASRVAVDFPSPDIPDPFDGSKDIRACRYAPSKDLIVVSRRMPPYRLDDGVPSFTEADTFFETRRADGTYVGKFGPSPEGFGLTSDTFSVAPNASLAVAALDGPGVHEVVAWDPITGKAKAELPVSTPSRNPIFSPDGTHLAVASDTTLYLFTVKAN